MEEIAFLESCLKSYILKDKSVDVGMQKSVGRGVSKVGSRKRNRDKRFDSFVEHEFLYFKVPFSKLLPLKLSVWMR